MGQTSRELFDAGRLNDAIEALGAELRNNPADQQRRIFLFEMLCFAGNWDRADKQLDILAGQDKDKRLGALLYRAALNAERTRHEMFQKLAAGAGGAGGAEAAPAPAGGTAAGAGGSEAAPAPGGGTAAGAAGSEARAAGGGSAAMAAGSEAAPARAGGMAAGSEAAAHAGGSAAGSGTAAECEASAPGGGTAAGSDTAAGSEASAHAGGTAAESEPVAAESEAPPAPAGGTLNGREFESIEDSDPRIGARLEVLAADSYMWIPLEHIAMVEMQPPKRLRDLLWAPAIIHTGPAFQGADLGRVLLPVLSPFSWRHGDDAVRLGRKTVWENDPGGGEIPFGQKMLLVDGEEVPLLEVRKLEFRQPAAG